MNIAPMIDVVFLLIIFFMTVSTLTRVEGESVDLPEAEEMETQSELSLGRIIINVKPDGGIIVSGREETLASLSVLLGEEVEQRGADKVSVLIRGDRNADWEDVGRVMQTCATHGIDAVTVAAIEPGQAIGQQ